MSENPLGPLRSLTVLSIEQAMTLPYLTLRLAEEGMRVIRLENPSRADPNRYVGPQVIPTADGFESGMNAYYLPNNLGKEAITLNLGIPEGRALLHRLIAELPVDIFATNQRPKSYQKLGIEYEQLRISKPDLIWVGITGFGPEHDEAAYDPILQARAGFMELTGDPAGEPMVFGLPMVDLGAAEQAYGQVMKALYVRQATGEGSRLDISMYHAAVAWMVLPVMLTVSFGERVTRRGNKHPFFAPVAVYPTKDGYVYIAVGSDHQWEAVVGLEGFETLAQEEYRRNAGRIAAVKQLNHAMGAIIRSWETDRLIETFKRIGVPISKVNTISDVCEDPLIVRRLVGATDPVSGLEITIAPPPAISSHLRELNLKMSFPPRLGEHNEAIYGALGCQVDELQAKGIV